MEAIINPPKQNCSMRNTAFQAQHRLAIQSWNFPIAKIIKDEASADGSPIDTDKQDAYLKPYFFFKSTQTSSFPKEHFQALRALPEQYFFARIFTYFVCLKPNIFLDIDCNAIKQALIRDFKAEDFTLSHMLSIGQCPLIATEQKIQFFQEISETAPGHDALYLCLCLHFLISGDEKPLRTAFELDVKSNDSGYGKF